MPVQRTYEETKVSMTKDVLAMIEKHFPEIDQSKITFDFEKLEIHIADLPEQYQPIIESINSLFKRLKQKYENNISKFN